MPYSTDIATVLARQLEKFVDLLMVLEHELGHILGHDHTEYGLMSPTLATGVREDQFFAGL